ncbi:hypothetical protein BDV3_005098 [Batrachochytrium dendrobatidis]|uniref:chitin deacetylase n=1 Tax=Batrachochytrium dendrobatidis (strain JEL423) TaxID=403673 RepID=A0A177WLF5_BATDL|nr:chitin deacetylase [Batrachochytrium dendrobatidis]OAJ40636.1 hypothetical protein BDEG_24343 [Batrachochytrium dendrobatidis JEL423]
MKLSYFSLAIFPKTVLLSAFILGTLADTPDSSKYPELDKVPAAVASWSKYVLANVPNIPVNAKMLSSTDWSEDVTTCLSNNQWGLTYDDGPSDTRTDDLLKTLSEKKVKATFFVVGSRVLQSPDVLLRTYQAGHEIGLHTWSHPAMTTVSNERLIAEIVYTAQIVKQVIGVTPRFIRPPYGDIDARVRKVLKNLGLTIVLWNVDSQDADGAKDVAVKFGAQANAGSSPVISLEHDLFPDTEAQAASALTNVLAGSGKYNPMPIGACLGMASYDEGFWDRINGNGANPPPPPASASAQASSVPSTATQNSQSASSQHTTNAGSNAATTPNVGANAAATPKANSGLESFHVSTVASTFAIILGICMAI